jgi:osmotically-inducible protein OsmY
MRGMGYLIFLAACQAQAYQVQPPQHAASQVHSSADAQLLASVRQAIANDNGLSDAGRHVNVIVEDGAVVLRGPVKDDTEKARIDALVRKVNGVKEVTNELDVKQ